MRRSGQVTPSRARQATGWEVERAGVRKGGVNNKGGHDERREEWILKGRGRQARRGGRQPHTTGGRQDTRQGMRKGGEHVQHVVVECVVECLIG